MMVIIARRIRTQIKIMIFFWNKQETKEKKHNIKHKHKLNFEKSKEKKRAAKQKQNKLGAKCTWHASRLINCGTPDQRPPLFQRLLFLKPFVYISISMNLGTTSYILDTQLISCNTTLTYLTFYTHQSMAWCLLFTQIVTNTYVNETDLKKQHHQNNLNHIFPCRWAWTT